MPDFEQQRARMLERQLVARGITDPKVQEAFRTVPRELFLAEALAEFAYEDSPLAIEHGQTISQPYIVAVTVQALELRGDERVLEIGTGSGYAAAILSRIAQQVYTVERIASLADTARDRLSRLSYTNVQVACADGTLGWPEHAPFDAIAVAAGGPQAPPALLSQLAIGGRLVMPIGPEAGLQVLVRITRESESAYREQPLADVRFVPLIGEQGFAEQPGRVTQPARSAKRKSIVKLVRETAEPIDTIQRSPHSPSIGSTRITRSFGRSN